jgi:hypothetical protein
MDGTFSPMQFNLEVYPMRAPSPKKRRVLRQVGHREGPR